MEKVSDDLATLPSLLSAYAGPDAPRHRLVWALDARFSRLVATTSEPVIGQTRMAWWNDALTDESGVRGRGEPLIDAMREIKGLPPKSEEHTSELQSLMRISYAVFCLNKKKNKTEGEIRKDNITRRT